MDGGNSGEIGLNALRRCIDCKISRQIDLCKFSAYFFLKNMADSVLETMTKQFIFAALIFAISFGPVAQLDRATAF